VLARAIRIMNVEPPIASAKPRDRPRFLARPLLKPIADPLVAALPGARGPELGSRQILYAVDELSLEIDVQVRQGRDALELDVRGQLFPLDDQSQSVAAVPVEVDASAGARHAVTSQLGAFRIETPHDASRLLVHLRECIVEVPIPVP
jgi:hypothetical protein